MKPVDAPPRSCYIRAMPESKLSIWRELWRRSTPLDRLIAGYVVAFAIAMATLGRDDSAWLGLVIAHAAILVGICLLVWFWHDQHNGVAGFLRHLYPILLYSLFYRELESADFWVFPDFFDATLVAFERSIFGVDPNVWLIKVQTAWANEIMMLGYFSYYFLIPVVALPLFLRGRLEDLRGLLYGTTLAFVMSYIGFVLFPVEGPRYYFSEHFREPLQGWLFVPAVRYVIDNGAIHGGCMPSSHVAVALVALFWARRSLPLLGSILTPFVFVLILATVWGRFHYATDAVVGIIVGAVALWLTGFWVKRPARFGVREFSLLNPSEETGAVRERV